MKSISAALRRLLDDWVHASVAGDALAASRHRVFIGGALASGLMALGSLPLYVALHAAPGIAAAGAFALLAAPVLVAVYVSRTGRLEAGNLIVALLGTGLVLWLAAFQAAPAPILLAGLALVPVEAALAGSREVTVAAALAALLGMACMLALGVMPLRDGLLAFALLSYSGLLALRFDTLGRDGERASLAHAARVRLLSDHASEMISRHGADGSAVFVSDASRRLCGLAPKKLVGRGLFERVHIADRPAFLCAIADALADRPSRLTLKLERQEPHGGKSFFHAEMRCRPGRDPQSGERLAIAAIRDVSGEVALEAELAEARAAAERAERAKAAFLAHMTHELRTPLNAIIGFSEILRDETLDRLSGERRHDYARLIHASGSHLLAVVNEILDLSRIEAGGLELSREPLAVAPLLEECCELLHIEAAARQVTISRDIPAHLPEIEADPRACRQMLINILANAIKFSHAGGRVLVSAREAAGKVEVAVRDFGVGIAASDLPRIGTPFFQADSAYDRRFGGSGLGLSVVTRLAELHGGALRLTSELGVGTTATIALPSKAAAKTFSVAQDAAEGLGNAKELKRA